MAVYGRRTPKSGLLRVYMLMSERKKIILIVCLTIFGLYMLQALLGAMFGSSKPPAPQVTTTLSEDEVRGIEEKIREELMVQYNNRLKVAIDQANSEIERVRSALAAAKEEDKGTKDISHLEKELDDALNKRGQALTQLREEHELEVHSILSKHLQLRQSELLQKGSEEILDWLCTLSERDLSSGLGLSVVESEADMGEQQCIGVASGEEKVFPSIMYTDSPFTARDLASKLVDCFGTTLLKDLKVAMHQYRMKNDERCCDRVYFVAHPVFGVFYRHNVPLLPKSWQGEGEGIESSQFKFLDNSADAAAPGSRFWTGVGSNFFGWGKQEANPQATGSIDGPHLQKVCYRREWDPKPYVKPLTRFSNVKHLLDPSDLAVPVQAKHASRQLADFQPLPNLNRQLAAAKHPPLYVIIPFRAENHLLLPPLLRSISDANHYRGGSYPIKVIISPIKSTPETLLHIRTLAKQAFAAAGLEISLVTAAARTQMNPPTIKGLMKKWIQQPVVSNPGGRRLQEEFEFWKKTQVADILPNDWLAAVIGALHVVPRSRAHLLILDSASYYVPENIARLASWRIVNGAQVFFPVSGSSETFENKHAWDEELESALARPQWWAPVKQTRRLRSLRGFDPQQDPLTHNWDVEGFFKAGDEDIDNKAGLDNEALTASFYDEEGTRKGTKPEKVEVWTPPGLDAPGTEIDEEDTEIDDGDIDDYDQIEYLEEFADEFESDIAEVEVNDRVLNHNRFTAIGITKSDLAGAIYRLIASAELTPSSELSETVTSITLARKHLKGPGEADWNWDGTKDGQDLVLQMSDNCIARRILRQLVQPSLSKIKRDAYAQNVKTTKAIGTTIKPGDVQTLLRSGYSITRSLLEDYFVRGSENLLVNDPQMDPCECDFPPWSNTLPHCAMEIAQTTTDDEADNSRVSCAVTMMQQMDKQLSNKLLEKIGALPDARGAGKIGPMNELNVDLEQIRVARSARRLDITQGVDILASVMPFKREGTKLKADDDKVDPEMGKKNPWVPEQFLFRWMLKPERIPYIPSDEGVDLGQ